MMKHLDELLQSIEQVNPYKHYGKVLRVVGIMIESLGPAANIGEVCQIHQAGNSQTPILAEVVGFDHEKVILMPYTEVTEIGSGCLVESTGKPLMIKVGRSLIGMTTNALGRPLNESATPKGLTQVMTEQS